MDSFEWNKIAGGVLAAALSVMLIRIVTEDVIFAHHELEEDAYPIAVAEVEQAPEAAEEEGPSLAQLLADASAEQGERIFRQCQTCHTIEQGGKNATGPNLYGVVGASKASHEGFNYSSAMTSTGGTWGYEELNAFLANPRGYVSGTKMSFAGLRRDTDRAKVIQYLRSFSPDAPPLPEVETASVEGEGEGAMTDAPVEN